MERKYVDLAAGCMNVKVWEPIGTGTKIWDYSAYGWYIKSWGFNEITWGVKIDKENFFSLSFETVLNMLYIY